MKLPYAGSLWEPLNGAPSRAARSSYSAMAAGLKSAKALNYLEALTNKEIAKGAGTEIIK